MARGKLARVADVKAGLVTRLRSGTYQIGDRFLSARALAGECGVSYQTAHRLLAELTEEGLLERRAASGTFVASKETREEGETTSAARLYSACLVFSARARRLDSFGARLLSGLTARLKAQKTVFTVRFADETGPLSPDVYPVLWESSATLQVCITSARSALLLNARPTPSLASARLDSVSVDDAFGGACAADLLLRPAIQNGKGLAILGGPSGDARSEARKQGFLMRAPRACVQSANGWYEEHGEQAAPLIVPLAPSGLFCANDRLAEGVLNWCARENLPRPRLVGFDDAPVAARLNLSTIAIPWDELIADAADIILRRISGDVSAARRRIVTPRSVVRLL